MRSIAERVLPRTAKLEVLRTSRIVAHGGVSERPKERASKARVGETQPWVQIPPPPPVTELVRLASIPIRSRET